MGVPKYEMLISEMRLSAHQYLHGSAVNLKVGTILEPKSVAGIDDDIEELLEKHRPAGRIARHEAVFVARDLRALENVARSDAFIYVVEPTSIPQRLDHAWVNRIWSLLAKAEEVGSRPDGDQLSRLARRYWSGRPIIRLRGEEHIWEYLCKSAVVVSPWMPS